MVGAARTARAPGLHDLEDALIVKVLGHLGLLQRHATAALVCRRWAQLVNDPLLLAKIFFSSQVRNDRQLACAHSFCAWLEQRGPGGVRRLHVRWVTSINCCEREQALYHSTLTAAAACGASLEVLRFEFLGVAQLLLPAALPASLPRLRSLDLRSAERARGGALGCDASLAPMTALQDLKLACPSLRLQPDAALSASLTNLRLDLAAEVPRQVASLTNLRRLALVTCQPFDKPQPYAPLAQLGASLETLTLWQCASLPDEATLKALTRLQTLGYAPPNSFPWDIDADSADLSALLRALSGTLRTLCLGRLISWDGVAPALAACTALREFRVCDQSMPSTVISGVLGQLHRLAVPVSVLAACGDGIAAAEQLEWLGVALVSAWPPGHDALLSAAMRLPRMRRVSLYESTPPRLMWDAASIAARRGIVFVEESPDSRTMLESAM